MTVLKIKSHRLSSGFTLVELLIGLALSILLAGIIGAMYVSSNIAFGTSTGLL